MDTKEDVLEKFSKLLKLDRSSLSEDTVIADVVRDSLAYFELFLELEKNIGKKLSFEDVIDITTLRDVVIFFDREKQNV